MKSYQQISQELAGINYKGTQQKGKRILWGFRIAFYTLLAVEESVLIIFWSLIQASTTDVLDRDHIAVLWILDFLGISPPHHSNDEGSLFDVVSAAAATAPAVTGARIKI